MCSNKMLPQQLRNAVLQLDAPDPLRTPSLSLASRIGDVEAVKQLLKKGLRPDSVDNRGWTPLHEAAAAGHVSCLVLLLRTGYCYTNVRTHEGETPLFLAVKPQINQDIIKILINYRAEINLGNNEDITPLHKACSLGLFSCAQLLIESGANVNSVDADGNRPIHNAIEKRSEQLVELLVDNGADLTAKNNDRLNPLMSAALIGFYEVIDKLNRATLNLVNNREADGRTALMMAAQFGCLKTVKALLRAGADANIVSSDRLSALHLAAHGDDPRLVECLVEVTSVEALNKHSSCSPIILAIDSMQIESLKHLLQWIKKCPEMREKLAPQTEETNAYFPLISRGMGAISYLLYYKAEQEQFMDIFKLLLDHGFAVDSEDCYEVPPLVAIVASSADHKTKHSVIKLLIENGADLERYCWYHTQYYESLREYYGQHEVERCGPVPSPNNMFLLPAVLYVACSMETKDMWLIRLLMSLCWKCNPDYLLRVVYLDLRSHSSVTNFTLLDCLLDVALELGISDNHTLFCINNFCLQKGMDASVAEERNQEYLNLRREPHSPTSLSQLCRPIVRLKYSPAELKLMQIPTVIQDFLNYVF